MRGGKEGCRPHLFSHEAIKAATTEGANRQTGLPVYEALFAVLIAHMHPPAHSAGNTVTAHMPEGDWPQACVRPLDPQLCRSAVPCTVLAAAHPVIGPLRAPAHNRLHQQTAVSLAGAQPQQACSRDYSSCILLNGPAQSSNRVPGEPSNLELRGEAYLSAWILTCHGGEVEPLASRGRAHAQ